jgi:hypothetical protein
MNNDNLKQRTKLFALEIVKLFEKATPAGSIPHSALRTPR